MREKRSSVHSEISPLRRMGYPHGMPLRLLSVLIIPVFMLAGCICPPAVKVSKHHQALHKEVQDAYDEYFQLWNAGDVQAIARDSWTAPGWISLNTTEPLPDAAAIEATYASVQANLKAKGWSYSKQLHNKARVLNENSVLLQSTWTRHLEDGSTLEPHKVSSVVRDGTYLYLKLDGTWRIAALFMSD